MRIVETIDTYIQKLERMLIGAHVYEDWGWHHSMDSPIKNTIEVYVTINYFNAKDIYI